MAQGISTSKRDRDVASRACWRRHALYTAPRAKQDEPQSPGDNGGNIAVLAALNLLDRLFRHLEEKGLLDAGGRNEVIAITVADLRASRSPSGDCTADFIDRVFADRKSVV